MRRMDALPDLVTRHLADVRALCEKYRVKRLAIFGSAVKGTFDEATSDLDFVVEFSALRDPITGRDTYFGLRAALSDLFERDVDLVEWEAVTSQTFRKIVEMAQRELYAA
jgi:predicted nucleotidyltransferase